MRSATCRQQSVCAAAAQFEGSQGCGLSSCLYNRGPEQLGATGPRQMLLTEKRSKLGSVRPSLPKQAFDATLALSSPVPIWQTRAQSDLALLGFFAGVGVRVQLPVCAADDSVEGAGHLSPPCTCRFVLPCPHCF